MARGTYRFLVVIGVLFQIAALRANAQTPFGWQVHPGMGQASLAEGGVLLSLSALGQSSAETMPLPLTPGMDYGLTFSYTVANLSPDVHLTVRLRWLDAKGIDIDEARRALGFPLFGRVWDITGSHPVLSAFADNVTAPDNASHAVLLVKVERERAGVPTTVALRDFRLAPGHIDTQGIAAVISGPDDAGPLSVPDANTHYGINLVSSGDFEEGNQTPLGWRVAGNNSQAAAVWQRGGAFSGKRCLKISDSGPLVKSWGEPNSLALPGGAPDSNYADARSEVSARWVSEPVPAVPGQAYQATEFVWYANRQEAGVGETNPVRLQFLDQSGKSIPPRDVHDDWLPNADPFTLTGWIPVFGKPVIAPANTVSVRAVVALLHSFYSSNDQLTVAERRFDRGYVLVDNVSIYPVRTTHPPLDPFLTWQAAAATSDLPFVADSIGHRPNSTLVESETDFPGGIAFVPAHVALRLTNLLGDRRALRLDCDLLDVAGKLCTRFVSEVTLPPFNTRSLPIRIPNRLPLGPYTIRYRIVEAGRQTGSGETRFAMMQHENVPSRERARMDYPFGLWTPGFPATIGTHDERTLGLLLQTAGAGKTWFGVGSAIYLDPFLALQGSQLQAAIDKAVAVARTDAAVWRHYGLTPMGRFEPPHEVISPSDYPRYGRIIAEFVRALSPEIRFWRYGTEYTHGGIKELDVALLPPGQTNVQGSRNYLNWGRRGTVRQYYQEYLVAYTAAKGVDAKVIFGPQSAGDTNGDVARLFFLVGTKNDLDSFGMNTYLSAFTIWQPNMVQFRENGVPDLPLFISEFAGQNVSPSEGPAHFDAEQDAVRRMVTYWTTVLAAFPHFFAIEQSTLDLSNRDNNLLHKGRVRPQYVAFATMSRVLGAGTFTTHWSLPQAEVFVRQRTMPNGPVAVLWSTGPRGSVQMEVGTSQAVLCDVYGNQSIVRAKDGIVEITLSTMPQYLLGAKVIRPAKTVQMLFRHVGAVASQPHIAVTVANERPETLSGTLTVQAKNGLHLRPSSYHVARLRGGERREFLFDVTSLPPTDDHRLPFKARFTTQSHAFTEWGGLNFAEALQASVPPEIDGDLSDWPQTFPLAANRPDQVSSFGSSKPWGGPFDLSGRLALRWDTKYLYVAARVIDDVFAPPQTPDGMFRSDCLEMLLDVHRSLKSGANFEQFTFAALSGGAQIRRYDGPLPQGQVSGAQISVKHTGSETDYEAAIPWQEIDRAFAPHPGSVISLAFSFDDSDGPGTGRRAISWFSLASDKNPANFGDVTLTSPP